MQQASAIDSGNNVRERIEAIPLAMRQMGWSTSAALMDRWLRTPAWMLPDSWKKEPPDSIPSAHVDQRIVRMSWAMSHPRVRIAMKLLRERVANEAARQLLRKRMVQILWGRDNRMTYGSTTDTALMLDKTCQSNSIKLGDTFDTMDDLYGALGVAMLKVALIGEAVRDPQTGRITLQATHVGFYIRDTYDFNGLQYLGTWTSRGVLSKSKMMINSMLEGAIVRNDAAPIGNVFNHDFQTYRRVTGFGGDFVLYSDVHWEALPRTLEMVL